MSSDLWKYDTVSPRPSRSTPEAQRRGQDVNPGEYIILKIKWARAAQRSNPRPSHSTPEAQRRGQDVNPGEYII
ncbi:MAG: hypothetical protein ACOYKH_09730 [Brevefilum fermentans]